MAPDRTSAPGISAAPAKYQLLLKLKSRLAKNPNSHASGQYTVAKQAQITIRLATTKPAAMARMAGAQAPHHGPSSPRLKGSVQPRGYAARAYPNREKTLQSVR